MSIYEPCAEPLYRFIISFINNKFDAKDIMSETILIAFEKLQNINEEKAFLSYLFTIARRLVYKRTRFNKRIDGSKHFDADDIANNDFGPEKINQINELNKALDKLPKKQKEAIILTAIHGFSYEETANIQETNIDNVKKRIYRGRQQLKKLLD